MSFRAYLENHYVDACDLQRAIVRDPQMIDMLRSGVDDPSLVGSWMREYGLFQGIAGPDRVAVVNSFLKYAQSNQRRSILNDEIVKTLYSELLVALYRQVPRSWMSAASKLLWCLYPESIVIYDAFVHRALLVMQRIDDDLAGVPMIGTPPTIKRESDIDNASDYYLAFQALVQRLKTVHAKTLKQLRERHHETYQYDIRILDKLLWMIGSPKRSNSWDRSSNWA